MEVIPHNVIGSASKALSVLTKVRCVESYSFSTEERFKILYAWPSLFEKDEKVLEWLKDVGVNSHDRLRVKSYSVSYNCYKEKKEVYVPEINSVRVARDILAVLILQKNKSYNDKIFAIWDRLGDPERRFPKSTSDIEGMRSFSSYADSMFVFSISGYDYHIKLPAYTYKAVFLDAGLFHNMPIMQEGRMKAVGEKTDREGRAVRYIVHKGNKRYLSSVLQETVCFIEKLAGNESWVHQLREDGKQFYKQAKT